MFSVLIVFSAVLLSGVFLVSRSAADRSTKVADVNEARILAEETEGNNWMVDGADFGERHFSPLKQITDSNVQDLGLAWWLDIPSPMGMAAEPIEVDGKIYVTD